MSKVFYEAMKARVKAGQYKLVEINIDLDKALGKGLISMEQYEELKALAVTSNDPTYEGNYVATTYDLTQDIEIAGNTMATLENFEMIMLIEETLAGLVVPMGIDQVPSLRGLLSMARSAIGDNYVRMILAGNRTFDSVPKSKKQEVADKLNAMGRDDLVTDPEYKPSVVMTPLEPSNPVDDIDPDFSVSEDVAQEPENGEIN